MSIISGVCQWPLEIDWVCAEWDLNWLNSAQRNKGSELQSSRKKDDGEEQEALVWACWMTHFIHDRITYVRDLITMYMAAWMQSVAYIYFCLDKICQRSSWLHFATFDNPGSGSWPRLISVDGWHACQPTDWRMTAREQIAWWHPSYQWCLTPFKG